MRYTYHTTELNEPDKKLKACFLFRTNKSSLAWIKPSRLDLFHFTYISQLGKWPVPFCLTSRNWRAREPSGLRRFGQACRWRDSTLPPRHPWGSSAAARPSRLSDSVGVTMVTGCMDVLNKKIKHEMTFLVPQSVASSYFGTICNFTFSKNGKNFWHMLGAWSFVAFGTCPQSNRNTAAPMLISGWPPVSNHVKQF